MKEYNVTLTNREIQIIVSVLFILAGQVSVIRTFPKSTEEAELAHSYFVDLGKLQIKLLSAPDNKD